MPIRAVISDVGDVLTRFDSAEHVAGVAELVGQTPAIVQKFLETPRMWDGVSEPLWRAGSRGVFTAEELAAVVMRHFGIDTDYVTFRRAWTRGFVGFTPTLGILDEVRRAHRVPIISCTDVDPIYGTNDHALVLRDYFDAEVQSWRVRALKPDPPMYEAVLEHARVLASARPDECLFIDDRVRNVEGARAYGMHAIHYFHGNPLYFRRELAEHGLAIPT